MATQNQVTQTNGVYDTPVGVGGAINTKTGQLINSTVLNPQNIQLPPPPTPTDYSGAAANGHAVVAANNIALTPQAAPEQDQFAKLFQQYQSSLTPEPSAQAIHDQVYNNSNYSQLEQTANDKAAAYKTAQSALAATTAQLQGLNAEAQGAQIQQDNRLAPTFAISGEQGAIDRARAIKAIPLQVQALAQQAQVASAQGDEQLAQGILQQAQTHLDTVFQLQMQDAQSQYQYKQQVVKSIYDFATSQEQRRLDAIQHQSDQDFQVKMEDIQNQHAVDRAKLEAQLTRNNALYAHNLSAGDNPTANYNGDFAATIDLAANTGGTNQQRTAIKNTLQSLIASGDYKSAYAAIQQSTAAALTGSSKTDFTNRNSQLGVTADLKTALSQLKAAGYDTNKLTGSADSIGTKLGVLATDPKYAAVANQVNLAFQNYRQQMTGAAFGAKESAEYASVLPGKGNTFALNMAKIDGLNSYLTSVVDSYTHQVVGDGGRYIREYAQGATAQSNTDPLKLGIGGVSTGGAISNPLGI